jgi:hypothetical protein
LTGEQSDKLTKYLKGDPQPIAIVSALLDGESSDFANDIDSAFKSAGWKTVRFANHLTSDRGLKIGMVGDPNIPALGMPFVLKVQKALSQAGVPCEIQALRADDHSLRAEGLEPRVLYLMIDRKPEAVMPK